MVGNETNRLDLVDRLGGCLGGLFLGALPPRVQMDIVENSDGKGYERAAFMSSVSRIGNLTISAVTLVGIAGKVSGLDIDSHLYDAALVSGTVVAIDTVFRELSFGFMYAARGGSAYMRHDRPWGSAVLSWIDVERHPDWYDQHDLNDGYETVASDAR